MRDFEVRELPEKLRAPGFVWIDFDDPTPEETALLSAPLNFHPLAVDDALHQSHFPKADDYGDYVYMVLHGAAAVAVGKERFRTIEIDFFLGRNFLVTHHTDPSRSINEVRELFMKAGDRFPNVVRLLHAILDLQVTRYLEVVEAFDKELEDLEEKVFKDPTPAILARIFALRKDLLHFRRTINPQREVLHRLSRNEFKVIPPDHAMFFRDIYDHAFRVSEIVDSFRETLTGALEGYLSVTSHRLNEIMKILTLVSVIILPMSLVAGIYGMNFQHTPEFGWRYGYAFGLGLIALVGFGFYVFFRGKRWL